MKVEEKLSGVIESVSEKLELNQEVQLYSHDQAKDYLDDPALPQSPIFIVPTLIEDKVPLFVMFDKILSIYNTEQLLQSVVAHELSHLKLWESDFPLLAIYWGGEKQESSYNAIYLDGQRLLAMYWPLDPQELNYSRYWYDDYLTFLFGYEQLGNDFWEDSDNFDVDNLEALASLPNSPKSFIRAGMTAYIAAKANIVDNAYVLQKSSELLKKFPTDLSETIQFLNKLEIKFDKEYNFKKFEMFLNHMVILDTDLMKESVN